MDFCRHPNAVEITTPWDRMRNQKRWQCFECGGWYLTHPPDTLFGFPVKYVDRPAGEKTTYILGGPLWEDYLVPKPPEDEERDRHGWGSL